MPDPFPYIKVSGSAHECGVKYGKTAKKQIRYNVDYYIGLWGRICGMTEREALKKASSTADPIRKYDAGIYEEIEGIAEGSGSKLEEILALNTRYELLFSQVKLAPGECTALAALPDATTVGHTLLAQNWDYRPGSRMAASPLRSGRRGSPSVLLHTEAGTVGHKGVNSHGIGIIVNALVSDNDHFEPTPADPRAVQEGPEQQKHATRRCSASSPRRGAVSSNVIIAQAGGVAVDLEMNPLDTSIMVPENGYIAHTNHFIGPRSLSVKDTFVIQVPNSVYRLSRTNATLRRWDRQSKRRGIKEMLQRPLRQTLQRLLHTPIPIWSQICSGDRRHA